MQQTHNNLTFHLWFLVLFWSLQGKIASSSVFKSIRVAKTCLWTRSIRCVRYTPGGRFSKVPKTFRARKAIRKTPTCLSCNAGIFICCKGNKNKCNCEVSCLETPSFWRYKENCHPKWARKVSGLSRNRPLIRTATSSFSVNKKSSHFLFVM